MRQLMALGWSLQLGWSKTQWRQECSSVVAQRRGKHLTQHQAQWEDQQASHSSMKDLMLTQAGRLLQ